jgi:hypothetical protein
VLEFDDFSGSRRFSFHLAFAYVESGFCCVKTEDSNTGVVCLTGRAMYIKRDICIFLGAILAGVILVLLAGICFLFLNKDVDIHDDHLQKIRESIILQKSVANLIHRSSEIVSDSPSIYGKQFEELQQIREKLHFLNQGIPAHVKSCAALASLEDESQKWEAFLNTWNKWYTHNLDFFQSMENVLANPSPQLVAEFHRNIAEGNAERLELTVKLNEIVFELTESSLLSVNAWSQKMRGRVHYTIAITIGIILLLLVILGLFGRSTRRIPGESFERLHALLKRHAGNKHSTPHSGTDVDEIVEIFSGVLDNLHEMFSSLQTRIQKVNFAVETLIQGIQQVATDQANLLSLSVAVESARPQDGFTQVSGEICALAERTQRLSTDIRDMAGQLRVIVNETMLELEQVARQIELDRTNTPLDTIREDVEKFSKTVSQISDALKIDPVQTMVSLKRDETG